MRLLLRRLLPRRLLLLLLYLLHLLLQYLCRHLLVPDERLLLWFCDRALLLVLDGLLLVAQIGRLPRAAGKPPTICAHHTHTRKI